MPRIAFTDLGGSLNQGRPPSALALNEWTAIQNFYQFGSKLRRVGGMRKLTSSAFTERITGMVYYRPDVLPPGGVDMIVAGPTRFGILVGGTLSLITPAAAFAIPSSTRRWSLFQYKNICYGIREGAGLVRSDGLYVGAAGIAAPGGAPTLADGAAGSIPAASFKGVYTFYNSATDMESNPSPVSNTLAHAGSKKIDWTGIGVSTNPQVTSRRLYRTLPDQSGEYFLVTEIPNNVDTTFTGDDVLAQDLDTAVSQVNGLPSSDLVVGAVWKERLFASDGVTLFHSADGLIEAFDPNAVIPVFPDDGHSIRAICPYGDRLVIGKTNKIHYLVGSDPSTFALFTLSDRHGCVSHHSMQVAEGYLFWLGLDNVYRSDGNAVTGIASVKLKTIIENMDASAARDAVATIFPTLGWYVLSIPGYAQLIYNYRTDVWTTMPTAADIQVLADFFTSDYTQEIYVADDVGNVYRAHDTTYGRNDSAAETGLQIDAEATGRAIEGPTSTKHIIEYASLLSDRYDEQITVEILSEGAIVKSRDVSLNFEPRWKMYSLSSRHQAKSQTQFKIRYTGATAIELEGYALDVAPINRPSMAAQ